MKSSRLTKRALWFLFILLVAVAALFSRFIYIQAAKEVQGTDLKALLEQRWSQTETLEGKRGSILDTNGEVLAEEIPSYTIVAVLDDRFDSYVSDPQATAEELSAVLDINQETLEAQLTRDAVQVELGARAKNISYEKKQEVEALELDGILFREDPRRYYPKQTFASHILGYTERDMSVARMGLESSLNDYLQETDGYITYQKDGRNRRLLNVDEVIEEPENGQDVYLTIDSRIQMAIEQTMNQVDEEFEPERMIAIVANANTGEILGMSNRPSFNPNQYENIENYTNFAVTSSFEPGSTMKVFSLAAAIEEGVFNPEETYQSGSYEVIDQTVRDHNQGRGWGEISYLEGVQRSSNVAFSKLALEKLGPETLYDYIDAFGFRHVTGIDLPNESPGLIADQYKIDAATTAFGQATAITPIQQVQAATAIANEGNMMTPYIVERIVDPTNKEVVYQSEPEVKSQPISEETAERVLEILETVITAEEGTGRPFAIDGFDVAGKTGTAQIPSEEGGYLTGHGNNIFSFIGMAPADDPEVIVYVAVDRPNLEVDEAGSEPVSMIFKQVMEQSLQYMNIAPTEEEEVSSVQETIEIGNYEDKVTEEAYNDLSNQGLDVTLIGDGETIIKQSHLEGTELIHGEKIILLTDDDDPLVPDLTGWSLRNVYLLEEVTGIDMEVEGSGFVKGQTPSPGSSMKDVNRMMIDLSSKKESDQEEKTTEEDEETVESEDQDDFFMD
ncbi:penicillin-binding protein [Salipaludibacillus agaradhaerens]|uniref:serine-type D-Ala-D-Ala carboxypeptidase n=1 Tax=Salipaludibacillus agaradhaerens TaxID=76935 RepID=A0A9Q4B091_SALAG|nr:penicillin-binding protein [Salipaludibacillus agaradhaerens]MCR6095939.1 penicillin-binding protein [Salipaludibacillus agaradhaerens]MCR6114502.1 penicillin-binding protein [Salipaludibacillus agaradhaerens]